MCTTEGWVAFMNLAVDSIGIGMQPIRNQNPIYQYLFIIYMIFGSLFITNLFIEVVINTFDKEKKAIDRNDRVTSF
jgi:voltage-dependent calcium channel L type alpha-1D